MISHSCHILPLVHLIVHCSFHTFDPLFALTCVLEYSYTYLMHVVCPLMYKWSPIRISNVTIQNLFSKPLCALLFPHPPLCLCSDLVLFCSTPHTLGIRKTYILHFCAFSCFFMLFSKSKGKKSTTKVILPTFQNAWKSG